MTEGKKQTKRQKLKALQKNDLNRTLLHQPKIKSMDDRERVDLRESGILGSKTKKTESLDPSVDVMNSPEVKFGRLLGSSDKRERHQAVIKLEAYLKARCDISQNENNGGFSEMDLLKLWKGLWYCLYMADKQVVQSEVAKKIAKLLWCFCGTDEEDEYCARMYLEMVQASQEEELECIDGTCCLKEMEIEGDDDEVSDDGDVVMKVMKNTFQDENDSENDELEEMDQDDDNSEDSEEARHCRGAHLACLFTRTFWATIRREWGNMDKYRLDKFYTLIRYMLSEIYKYMAKRHWNQGIVTLFNDALYEEILSQIPNGIRYHILDICLDELSKVNATDAPLPLTEQTFLDVLEPFFALLTKEQDPFVQERCKNCILNKFLDDYCVVSERYCNKSEEEENDENEVDTVFDNVHVGTIAEFIFLIASAEDTLDRYRESLYDIHKTYMKRLKKVGIDVEVAEPLDGDDGDEMDAEDAPSSATNNKFLAMETEEEYKIVDDSENSEADEKKSRKKKKKKSKSEKSDQKVEESPKPKETEPNDEESSSTQATGSSKKSKKKAKSSKKRKQEQVEEVKEECGKCCKSTVGSETKEKKEDTNEVLKNEEQQETKKERKPSSAKKRKKQKQVKEEVIVISTKAQKKQAALAQETSTAEDSESTSTPTKTPEKKKKNKKGGEDDQEKALPPVASSVKKVIFARINHSKSHKASMKALKTAEKKRICTATRTPEKGILRSKITETEEGDINKSTSKKKKSSKKKK